MNPAWLGDSYDVVKRFLLGLAGQTGYELYVDPMFTGDPSPAERDAFLSFVGAELAPQANPPRRSALLIDPDTGISRKSQRHVALDEIAARCHSYELLIVFDQSFSRSHHSITKMGEKLSALFALGVSGFYYDSHARFLLCSRSEEALKAFHAHLLATGLPKRRLVSLNAGAAAQP